MRLSILPLLACPDCRDALTLANDAVIEDDAVIEGHVTCSACTRDYPIQEGILRAMPSSLLAEQHSEIKARDEQVAQYDAMWYLDLFGKLEIPMTLRRLAPSGTNVALEAGCGTGRMTGRLAWHVKDLVAVDFSFESLRVNAAKMRERGNANVDFVQADLCALPFPDAAFDRVVSCQVLEHVPGPDARARAVASLSCVARRGATVVVSAYQHSVLAREKEGQHDGGIPFFRFTRAEFRELLGSRMRVNSVTGKLIYIFLARCTKEAA